jgi:hypothetical protein
MDGLDRITSSAVYPLTENQPRPRRRSFVEDPKVHPRPKTTIEGSAKTRSDPALPLSWIAVQAVVVGLMLCIAGWQYAATLDPIERPEWIKENLPRLYRQMVSTSHITFLSFINWILLHHSAGNGCGSFCVHVLSRLHCAKNTVVDA